MPLYSDIYRQTVMRDNPINYLRLNDRNPVNGSLVEEETESSINFTYTGNGASSFDSLIANNPNNNSVLLPSDNVHIATAAALPILTTFSFEATVRFETEQTNQYIIGSLGASFIIFLVNNKSLVFSSTGNISLGIDNIIKIGESNHIIGTRNSSNEFILYHNGLEVAKGISATTWPNVVSFIGGLGGAGTTNFNGYIDEFSIYNYALSPDQISSHYQAGTTLLDDYIYSTYPVVFGTNYINTVTLERNTSGPLAIYSSYINPSLIFSSDPSNMLIEDEVMVGGVPLSVSLIENTAASWNPGPKPAYYYAFDIIEDNRETNRESSFIYKGNYFLASETPKRSGQYFWSTLDIGGSPTPNKQIMFEGVPMMIGDRGELILNNTSLREWEELIEVKIGGIPVMAGRVGTKYYLIISPVVAYDFINPNPSSIL